jgi:hypothetical protein
VLSDDLVGDDRLKVCNLGFGFRQLLLQILDAALFALAAADLIERLQRGLISVGKTV